MKPPRDGRPHQLLRSLSHSHITLTVSASQSAEFFVFVRDVDGPESKYSSVTLSAVLLDGSDWTTGRQQGWIPTIQSTRRETAGQCYLVGSGCAPLQAAVDRRISARVRKA